MGFSTSLFGSKKPSSLFKVFALLLVTCITVFGAEPETSFECIYNEKEDLMTYREYYIGKGGERVYHGLTISIRNSKRKIGSTVTVDKEIYKEGKLTSSSNAGSTETSAEKFGLDKSGAPKKESEQAAPSDGDKPSN